MESLEVRSSVSQDKTGIHQQDVCFFRRAFMVVPTMIRPLLKQPFPLFLRGLPEFEEHLFNRFPFHDSSLLGISLFLPLSVSFETQKNCPTWVRQFTPSIVSTLPERHSTKKIPDSNNRCRPPLIRPHPQAVRYSRCGTRSYSPSTKRRIH